ncbi:hypothetical protein GWK26_07430 [haloarchaeon 3A1-DGR]|nr:hypothetical protein GWK26_07430 [haloarchaeon 3A1-DGR]
MSSDTDAAASRSIDPGESLIGRALAGAAARLSAAADESAILGIARRGLDRAGDAATDSTLADGGRFLVRTTRRSWLFRWLTAEPEPEVIVIDLRETWTVGPVIRLLDHLFDRLAGGVADSRVVALASVVHAELRAAPLRVAGVLAIGAGIATLGASAVGGGPTLGAPTVLALALVAGGALALRDDRSWATLRESKPVELLVAALEPPEPPEPSEPPEPPGANGDVGDGTAEDDPATERADSHPGKSQ